MSHLRYLMMGIAGLGIMTLAASCKKRSQSSSEAREQRALESHENTPKAQDATKENKKRAPIGHDPVSGSKVPARRPIPVKVDENNPSESSKPKETEQAFVPLQGRWVGACRPYQDITLSRPSKLYYVLTIAIDHNTMSVDTIAYRDAACVDKPIESYKKNYSLLKAEEWPVEEGQALKVDFQTQTPFINYFAHWQLKEEKLYLGKALASKEERDSKFLKGGEVFVKQED